MAPVEQRPASSGGLINTETAAALLMVTTDWVRKLTAQGWIPKIAKDQYRVADVVQGYIKYLKDETRKASKTASASRVQDARAEEIRLRVDEKRGALLEQGQAEAINVIDEFFGGLKSDLMAIPARVTSDIALRRRIEDEIGGAFGKAGKRAVAAADRVKSAGETLRATGETKPGRVVRKKPDVSSNRRKTRGA